MGDGQNDSSGKAFQLRPSILSGGGGFDFAINTNAKLSPKKDFLLRPSPLSTAAEVLEGEVQKGSNKRVYKEETEEVKQLKDETNSFHDITKKARVLIEEENVNNTIPLKLTEDIKKPTGIGTFGFAGEKKEKIESKDNKNIEAFQRPNYFAQPSSQSEKLKFVFGSSNSSEGPIAFSSIKTDNCTAEIENKQEDNSSDNVENKELNEKSTLLENADEYQRIHGQRRHFEEVECITGEEGEKHVLQILCKLHLFDKDHKTWLEKGRGTLKLNDICQVDGVFQSRLVFRTQGTNIVQLNTFLYPDMCCEQVKDKSIRISAINADTKAIDVYLVSCSLKDRPSTYNAIERRIQAIRRNQGISQTEN